jgi:DNA-binding GntR family transcriptional regulator
MKVKVLRDSITEYIRAQIIAGRLAPGQRLNEAGLSETLNVSRSPLREALLILERENLVVNIPRKGTYVTPMSEENMEMIYQVMEMVELYAIQNLKVKKLPIYLN